MQNSSQWPCSTCPIPQSRLVGMRISYTFLFPGHPEFWTPLQNLLWEESWLHPITKGFEALVFHAGTLGCIVCLTPQLFLSVHPHVNLRLPSPPATALPTWSASCHLAMHHLCLSCPVSAPPTSLDKISSLTPWLSNFHMV